MQHEYCEAMHEYMQAVDSNTHIATSAIVYVLSLEVLSSSSLSSPSASKSNLDCFNYEHISDLPRSTNSPNDRNFTIPTNSHKCQPWLPG